jgi:hypothetical protein
VGVPVLIFREGLVDAVVEVLVVREDNVAADIVELEQSTRDRGRLQKKSRGLTKPSGVMSVDARPPATSLLSTINHDGPSCCRQYRDGMSRTCPPYNLLQTLRSPKTSGTSANDEDINISE